MKRKVFTHSGEPVARVGNWDGMAVLDAGLDTRCAWATAKTLVEQLMEGRGEVVYGEMTVAGCKLGTLDLFMDAPAALPLPAITKLPQGELHMFSGADMAVGLFSELPAGGWRAADFMLATRDTGPLASVYRCYLAVAIMANEVLKAGFTAETLLWGWSTMVLPPLCDDIGLFEKRLAACTKMGGITSFWVRANSDEDVKAALRALPKQGERRLQNLKTANTFIMGKIDENGLKKALGLP